MIEKVNVRPLKAFNDNYIWVVIVDETVCVVDPGTAIPVHTFLEENALNLCEIWITHHHPDHISGITSLLARYPETVVRGPNHNKIHAVNFGLDHGDEFDVPFSGGFFRVAVIATPGHTSEHICFCVEQMGPGPLVFCGDTLFAAGCGRIFDGRPEQLFSSLERLSTLPAGTQFFPAHEYTLGNLRFAELEEPTNPLISKRLKEVQELREKDIPTLPTPLSLELETNPFLRLASNKIQTDVLSINMDNRLQRLELFAAMRERKNSF